MSDYCSVCGTLTQLQCGKCQRITYCGLACQTMDWNTSHQYTCISDDIDELYPNERRASLKDNVTLLPDKGYVVKIFDDADDYDAQVQFLQRNAFTGLVPSIVETHPDKKIIVTRYIQDAVELYHILENRRNVPEQFEDVDLAKLLDALIGAFCDFYLKGDNWFMGTNEVYDYIDMYSNLHNIGVYIEQGYRIVFFEGGRKVDTRPDLQTFLIDILSKINGMARAKKLYRDTKQKRIDIARKIKECLDLH